MSILTKFLINCLAVAAGAYFIPGIHIRNGIIPLIGVTLVISLLNALLKPLLVILTIPVTILTFGLFLFVINALVILIAGNMLDNFSVDGFWSAMLFSFVIMIVNWIFQGAK
ncbi:MAG: phage holin family protein [Bacteroidetes bacterium]|nr:phage holin family protein [Bacteroidota bacterium]